MTTFIDGPAKGQILALKSSPLNLLVVRDRVTGKWDALDQPGDEAKDTEEIWHYERHEQKGGFIDGTGISGYYSITTYKYVP